MVKNRDERDVVAEHWIDVSVVLNWMKYERNQADQKRGDCEFSGALLWARRKQRSAYHLPATNSSPALCAGFFIANQKVVFAHWDRDWTAESKAKLWED